MKPAAFVISICKNVSFALLGIILTVFVLPGLIQGKLDKFTLKSLPKPWESPSKKTKPRREFLSALSVKTLWPIKLDCRYKETNRVSQDQKNKVATKSPIFALFLCASFFSSCQETNGKSCSFCHPLESFLSLFPFSYFFA